MSPTRTHLLRRETIGGETAPGPRNLGHVPTTLVGGLRIACQTRHETAELFADIVADRAGPLSLPVYMTSANGQVLSGCATSLAQRRLFAAADHISADGQPMVVASRWLSRAPLPERCATTDLFHDVSRAVPPGTRYYLFGAAPAEIERAVERTREMHPHVDVCGASHGYLDASGEEAVLAEIDRLAPDILWIGLGVPREQDFAVRHRARLSRVRIIKTSGGLFNFLSGSRSRAPRWMQRSGLEWLYRLALEPRRLFLRYLTTNAHSLALLLLRTR